MSETSKKEIYQQAFLDIALESWRFARTFNRLLTKIQPEDRQRYKNQLNWFTKKLGEALNQVSMKIVNIEGQQYDSGMAATPLNIGDFDPEDSLEIDQMLEPIIMGDEGILKTGTVLLRKIEK